MRKRKVVFSRLLDSSSRYTLTEQLDIFGWMVRTGWDYRSDGQGVFEWLYGLSCTKAQEYNNRYGVPKGNTRDFLRLAFLRAILDESAPEVVKKWRIDQRIIMDSVRRLYVSDGKHGLFRKVYKPFDLTEFENLWLTEQWNPVHENARFIKEIRITTNAEGWGVGVIYGIYPDTIHSRWWKDLTARHHSSSLVIGQAVQKLKDITTKRNPRGVE